MIYRGKPRFSVFGVGDYTFAPWKVAVSGFYQVPRFVKVGPMGGKPVVFDDTVSYPGGATRGASLARQPFAAAVFRYRPVNPWKKTTNGLTVPSCSVMP